MFTKRITLDNLTDLPQKSGIYYAWQNRQVIYVGLATNLHQRWNAQGQRQHHKLDILKRLNRESTVTLTFHLVPVYRLKHEEALEIQRLDPYLNKQKPKPDNHYSLRIRVMDTATSIVSIAAIAMSTLLFIATANPKLADRLAEVLIAPTPINRNLK